MPKYKSPFSIDYRKPITISSEDPRARDKEKNNYISKIGRKVIINKKEKKAKKQLIKEPVPEWLICIGRELTQDIIDLGGNIVLDALHPAFDLDSSIIITPKKNILVSGTTIGAALGIPGYSADNVEGSITYFLIKLDENGKTLFKKKTFSPPVIYYLDNSDHIYGIMLYSSNKQFLTHISNTGQKIASKKFKAKLYYPLGYNEYTDEVSLYENINKSTLSFINQGLSNQKIIGVVYHSQPKIANPPYPVLVGRESSLVALDSNLNIAWQKGFRSYSDSYEPVEIKFIKTNSQNNILVSGIYSYLTSQAGPEDRYYDVNPVLRVSLPFVAKFNSSGNLIFRKTFCPIELPDLAQFDPYEPVSVKDIKFLNDGSSLLILRVSVDSLFLGYQYIIVKLNSDGNIIWQKKLFPTVDLVDPSNTQDARIRFASDDIAGTNASGVYIILPKIFIPRYYYQGYVDWGVYELNLNTFDLKLIRQYVPNGTNIPHINPNQTRIYNENLYTAYYYQNNYISTPSNRVVSEIFITKFANDTDFGLESYSIGLYNMWRDTSWKNTKLLCSNNKKLGPFNTYYNEINSGLFGYNIDKIGPKTLPAGIPGAPVLGDNDQYTLINNNLIMYKDEGYFDIYSTNVIITEQKDFTIEDIDISIIKNLPGQKV